MRAPEQRRIWEGALTGPIGHSKKTSFLLSGHRQEEDLDFIVLRRGLSGPIQENVASPKRDTQLSTHIDISSAKNIRSSGNTTSGTIPARIRAWAGLCCRKRAPISINGSANGSSATAGRRRRSG